MQRLRNITNLQGKKGEGQEDWSKSGVSSAVLHPILENRAGSNPHLHEECFMDDLYEALLTAIDAAIVALADLYKRI